MGTMSDTQWATRMRRVRVMWAGFVLIIVGLVVWVAGGAILGVVIVAVGAITFLAAVLVWMLAPRSDLTG